MPKNRSDLVWFESPKTCINALKYINPKFNVHNCIKQNIMKSSQISLLSRKWGQSYINILSCEKVCKSVEKYINCKKQWKWAVWLEFSKMYISALKFTNPKFNVYNCIK